MLTRSWVRGRARAYCVEGGRSAHAQGRISANLILGMRIIGRGRRISHEKRNLDYELLTAIRRLPDEMGEDFAAND